MENSQEAETMGKIKLIKEEGVCRYIDGNAVSIGNIRIYDILKGKGGR